MKRLCTICVRGGSKSVQDKNLRLLAGRPLVAHSIIQAKESGLFDAVAVSSDSESLLHAAAAAGADVLVRRPDDLATDTAPKLPAIAHCVREVERGLDCRYEVLVDLDATSPLRLTDDIAGAVSLLEESGVSNVITGAPARRSPYFNLVEVDRNGIAHLSKSLPEPVERRQDGPRCYDMNASIYAWRRDVFLPSPALFYGDTLLYEMPEERSVDIDRELDFDIVAMLMERRATSASTQSSQAQKEWTR